MNRCGNCGKYPLCESTNMASQEACDDFIKRKIGEWQNIDIKNMLIQRR